MILKGKGTAPGFAVGSVYVYNEKFNIPAESFVSSGGEERELERYLEIKKSAIKELEELRLSIQKTDPAKAGIFEAQKEIAEDLIINEEIPAKILNERFSGDWAIFQVYETVLNVLKKTPDPLISERAADFDDVRARLLRLWYGFERLDLCALKEPVVIAARELMPSDTAGLNKDKVLAIITETGGSTSHTAIIARSYGIPAILGVLGLLDHVKQGQIAAVDAETGTVILDPDENTAAGYAKKSEAFLCERQETEIFRCSESLTLDGVKIDIGLNIANPNDEGLKAENYVDFAGLFRTEFLYMGRKTLPSEEEQFLVYKKVLESFGNKPVILRTLDVGGDKPLSSVEMKKEENPFLGNRALRFCFSRPDILQTQIKAALRAGCYGNLWLMFPMVSSIDDIRKAKEQVAAAAALLKKEGQNFANVKTGIMIEIPSAALTADLAAKETDFASIGSNDLCQYLCAADRTNGDVESYYQSYHPAMFRLIKETVSAFAKAGKPISVCGELGSDIKALPALIGLGLRKLSMGEASVAAVKRVIRSVTVKKCEETAAKVLSLSSASEIEKYLSNLPS